MYSASLLGLRKETSVSVSHGLPCWASKKTSWTGLTTLWLVFIELVIFQPKLSTSGSVSVSFHCYFAVKNNFFLSGQWHLYFRLTLYVYLNSFYDNDILTLTIILSNVLGICHFTGLNSQNETDYKLIKVIQYQYFKRLSFNDR